ncbi:hypothetical protein [Bosea sp. (in: a-proteobacteria)]|jgi:hypothetical protein|uniref:hypothetical protein n=1 Tax=Bosea sp. (in: a-proteobacteria) TaxID=1871050 RepID=UPI002DDCBA04|nr:hypothetical protein [Bosea sp. (in: a-proteobacteria)]HEV2508650.1 hypothetical protein [Bosea sp. (in: a-proteobacteria)]
MTEPASILLSRVNGHGASSGGRNSCLDLTDSNGRRFILHIPHLIEGDFLSRFEAAAMHAADMRGSPSSADVVSAVLAEQTSFVMADDGTLILRTKTRAGVDIDLSFDDATVAELRTLLGSRS